MRKAIVVLLSFLLAGPPVFSQSDGEKKLLQKLDSLRNSSCISRHFAGLYFTTTQKAVSFFHDKDGETKTFIERLENRFADFFFRSVDSFTQRKMIPNEWKDYFTDSSLSSLQYQLLGINAHINGDIWKALTAEFSLEEIQKGMNSYYDFQKGLIKQYREFYTETVRSDPKLRLLHNATIGLDKLYGEMMLKRWRKRQVKLAILYYTDKEEFNGELEKLHKKMERIDNMIVKSL